MPRYQWSTLIPRCVEVLRRHDSINDALDEIHALGIHPTATAANLADAFRRGGHHSPSSFLKHMSPDPYVGSGVSSFVPRAKVTMPKGPTFSELSAEMVTQRKPKAELEFRGTARLTRILVIPDMHHPYADPVVWNVMLNAVRDLRPDVVVIIGDFLDCYTISNFPKTPGRKTQLKDEVDAAAAELDRLCSLRVPRIIWTEGNHEERLTRHVLEKAPALYGYIPTLPEYMNLRERGVEWVPYKDWIKIGKFAFTHTVGPCGVNATRASLTAFGNNIVVGHSHHAGVSYSGNVEGDKHVAISVGWGGDLSKIDYGSKPQQTREWQHAIGWIVEDETGCGWGTALPIINGRLIVDGMVIS